MLILHDYMEQTDGGSRLCLELAQGLKADFHCAFVRRGHPFLEGLEEGRAGWSIHSLAPALRLLPVPLLRQWLLALLFSHHNRALLARHEQVLYSGSYAPLAVRQHTLGKNILYCHTPPRFLYDQHTAFAATVPMGAQWLFRAFCDWLRPRYAQAARAMDVRIANSRAVQERMRHYLGLEADIIFPPCDTRRYSWQESRGYYLSMVRVDHLKRVDLLVRAFRQLPQHRLIIASSGPEAARLQAQSADCPHIHWAGVLSEQQRLDALAGCTATLCVAREEDFGMCAVESLAAGKPVIIAGAGGLREIVNHGHTGLCLAPDPSPEDIAAAVRLLDRAGAQAMRGACEQAAQQYDTARFLAQIREKIA